MQPLGQIFRPFESSFIQNPYPAYSMLRERDPVHQSDSGLWALTRYDDVVSALNDRRLSNRPGHFATVHPRNSHKYVAASVASNLIAFMDMPQHGPPRKLLASNFVRHLKGKEPAVAAVAERILGALRADGDIDFFRDFSVPFATQCTCVLMGFPVEDGPLLERWSNMLFYLFHSIPSAEILAEVNRALSEYRNYIKKELELRKTAPKDDLLTVLWNAWKGEQELDEQQLIDNCMLLTADGIENVQAGLATAVATLLQHQDQLDLLKERPELLDAAVDECLRYDSPGQFQGRIALETVEIGGKVIRAHSVVLLVLASANRDERAFSYPNRFMIERNNKRRHLAFGSGNHACIGGSLVNMEFRVALGRIFDGTRDVTLATDSLSWTARAGHRWPEALPLQIRER